LAERAAGRREAGYYPTNMADVFVSYSRSDKARVAPLVAAIEAQGWSVWWDPVITPGQEFDVEIAAELKIAAAVLVVWTPNSVTSRWVRGEARDGADRGILVPVRFDGAELPIDVRALHTIDLDAWSKDDRSPQIEEILRTVRAVVARQRGTPAVQVNSAAAPAPGHSEAARIEICVLPFANMSGDPAQEYFSDGITEDIITELSRWRLLAVRSRSASFRYRGVAVDIKQVARELSVHFVVEGSVRRMGDRIRISVQLIDAQTGSQIWSEKFDRRLDEIFAVQDRVVQTIVSTLVGRVQASDVERARRKPPASLAAYECVLRANALPWDDPDGMAQAIRLVEKSIELDPAYGFAYALLASLRQAQWSDGGDSDAALEEAYALAMRAVALDDGESTCHAILGHVCVRRRSFELAVQYAQRAVEINPNNQWNAADLGSILVHAGRSEEALTWFARAREIDPYFDTPWYWHSIALAYMTMQRYGDALANLSHARVRTHRYTALMAGCQAKLGDMEGAKSGAAECLRARPDFSIEHFMRKEPFKIPADAEQIASALRLAGLPDEPVWVTQVLHFWFDELGEAQWYAKSEHIDARIRARFLSLHERIVAQEGFIATTPRALLAAVIVLDQFSRNLYRGTPRAFAADPIARQLSRTAIGQGFDLALNERERLFLYLPFEHSEDRDDQALAVELIGRLGNAGWTHYAIAHKAIIDQFGRFPHRNAILNRQSSTSEIALLEDPKDWF
jgi:uncharacterized protein (DUF924 family)/TolB-like protein